MKEFFSDTLAYIGCFFVGGLVAIVCFVNDSYVSDTQKEAIRLEHATFDKDGKFIWKEKSE